MICVLLYVIWKVCFLIEKIILKSLELLKLFNENNNIYFEIKYLICIGSTNGCKCCLNYVVNLQRLIEWVTNASICVAL